MKGSQVNHKSRSFAVQDGQRTRSSFSAVLMDLRHFWLSLYARCSSCEPPFSTVNPSKPRMTEAYRMTFWLKPILTKRIASVQDSQEDSHLKTAEVQAWARSLRSRTKRMKS